jgi:hypothetical protein
VTGRARWTTTLALGAVVGGAACGHTREAEDPSPKEAKKQEQQQEAKRDETRPAASPKGGGGSGARRRASKDNPTPAPLSTSPEGLLEPGAEKKIQAALARRGLLDAGDAHSGQLDGPTKKALRRFQHDADLPETGVPDRETIRRLGLPPDDLFKKTDRTESD